jgi:hypothetical protein
MQFVCDLRWKFLGGVRKQIGPLFGKIAVDERVTQFASALGILKQIPKTAVEESKGDPTTQFTEAWGPTSFANPIDRILAFLRFQVPEFIACQVKEWILNRWLVPGLSNNLKLSFEGCDQIIIYPNLVIGNCAPVNFIDNRQQKHGLVRSFVRTALVAAQVVKSLQPSLPDGLGLHVGIRLNEGSIQIRA